jgi:hypothetical protein
MSTPVLNVNGSLTQIPKTIIRAGKRWEQGPGAHTLTEVRKIKSYWDKETPYNSHMIVKAIYERWTTGISHPVKETFYFVYQRRK